MEIYFTDKDLAQRFKVTRVTIWNWVKSDNGFPAPVRFSGRVTRWKLSDIEKWERLRAIRSAEEK